MFVPYEKMGESLARLGLDEGGVRALGRVEWVVTEKVHGASFCLLVDAGGGPLRCAKRKALLEDDGGEEFFGHRALVARIGDAAREVAKGVLARHRGARTVAIHGELFGGRYPHPDVAPVPSVEPVQTGIHYSPRIEHYAFDIAILDGAGGRAYLDFAETLAHLEAGGLFAARPLFVGRYEEALASPIEFPTTIPARLGLPPLDDNPAEGVVIKPMTELLVDGQRPIFKRKIARFAEDERFHRAEKWRSPPSGDVPALTLLEWELLARCNRNRLDAVRSKLGPRAAGLVAELVADVWAEVAETQAAELARLSPSDRALLDAILTDEAHRLVNG